MLSFEAALAQALGELGVCPQHSADAIMQVCLSIQPDEQALQASQWSNATVVPALVDQIRRQLPDHCRAWVHFGATSQDTIDTAFNISYVRALSELDEALRVIARQLAALVVAHKTTITVGRTLMQGAAAMTLGLRFATWLDSILDLTLEIQRARNALSLQFGGSVGNLALLGEQGLDVGRLIASALGLKFSIPWHTNRYQRFLISSAITLGSIVIEKISEDLILLSQDDIGELSFSSGSSSTLPNKRNAALAIGARTKARVAFSNATGAMGNMSPELERGAGSWQAENQILPLALDAIVDGTRLLTAALAGLEIHTECVGRRLGEELCLSESLRVELEQTLGFEESKRVLPEILELTRNQGCSLGAATKIVTGLEARVDLLLGSNQQIIDTVLRRLEDLENG
ncbi:lyase family protein [Ferrimicrobium sp.]|nr:lyase family protein [Ferrimicrobium sp.]